MLSNIRARFVNDKGHLVRNSRHALRHCAFLAAVIASWQAVLFSVDKIDLFSAIHDAGVVAARSAFYFIFQAGVVYGTQHVEHTRSFTSTLPTHTILMTPVPLTILITHTFPVPYAVASVALFTIAMAVYILDMQSNPASTPLPQPGDAIGEVQCRICYGDEGDGRLFVPCLCRGSMQYIHEHCLERLRQTEKEYLAKCPICRFTYRTQGRSRTARVFRSVMALHAMSACVLATVCLAFATGLFVFTAFATSPSLNPAEAIGTQFGAMWGDFLSGGHTVVEGLAVVCIRVLYLAWATGEVALVVLYEIIQKASQHLANTSPPSLFVTMVQGIPHPKCDLSSHIVYVVAIALVMGGADFYGIPTICVKFLPPWYVGSAIHTVAIIVFKPLTARIFREENIVIGTSFHPTPHSLAAQDVV